MNLIPYEYEPYTKEEAEEDAKRGSSKTNFVKLLLGKNRLRVLPKERGKQLWSVTTEHMGKFGKGGGFVKFVCPGKGCPACATEERLSRTGNANDRKLAQDMRARKVYRTVAIQRGREDEGPLVWEITQTSILDGIRKLREDEDVGGDYTDPNGGFDILIEREGSGFDTRYTTFPARHSTPLSTDVELAMEWLEKRPNVGAFIFTKTIEEIVADLEGGDDDERPRSGQRQLPGTRSAAPKAAAKPAATSKRRTAQDDVDEDAD